jgi:hypothetical protein
MEVINNNLRIIENDMKPKFSNVSGMSITRKGILRSILMIMIFIVFRRESNMDIWTFWMVYLIADLLTESVFFSYLEKLIKQIVSPFNHIFLQRIVVKKRDVLKIIFTIGMFCMDNSINDFKMYIIWFAYIIADSIGERISREKWTKEIWGTGLREFTR